ncbi:helix-turn-helix transcriptional regulator [Oscillatoria amoena NRMC-F 0135]|nr:helix-turn-helix transcriptional regulator [Oscillatoria amoena NRMC-F 0135]
MSLEETIARNIVTYRKSKGLTQLALCERAKLKQAQLSALENGRAVNIKTLERIAIALEVPPYVLLKDPETESQWFRQKLEEVELLSKEKRDVLNTVLTAMLHEEQLQKLIKK